MGLILAKALLSVADGVAIFERLSVVDGDVLIDA
jgi:hypothetical protein